MEFNNLLSKIKPKVEEDPKNFLALEITDEIVQSAIWQVRNARTEVVSTGSVESWSESNPEDLVEKIDKSISQAVIKIDSEPDEMVFGIPNHWVKEDKIIPAKLELIKKISKDLELKPLGFVVIIDSLIKYLKIREGTPASAIFVHVSDSEINVSLVNLGVIAGTHSVGRSDDIANDVEEGISRFKGIDTLPSRIIVFNSNQDLEELVQDLNSYEWQGKFNFLHLPKIESLPKDAAISAIAVAGGSEVAKSIGFEINFESSAKDIESSKAPNPTVMTTKKLNPKEFTSDNLGFVKDADIQEIINSETLEPEEFVADSPEPDLITPSRTIRSKTSIKTKLNNATSIFKTIKLPMLSVPKFNKTPSLSKPLLFAIGGFLLLAAVIYFAIWNMPKTTVTLQLETKTLEESLELTISERVQEVNIENVTIPGESVAKTVSGKDSVSTTGDKTIGDPAKGEVTVYNRTVLEKTFNSGTEISYGNLTFTFDDSVTIASGSAQNEYIGKATVKVTAESIGEDSNLSSNTEFTVANYSKDSFVAKNESSFTGGTSSQIRVVSKEDIDNLLSQLTDKLEGEAKESLSNESNETKGVFIQDELTKVIKEDYSAKLNEEVDTLSLELELSVKGLFYNNSDIEELINSEVENAIPNDYIRADQPIEVETSSPTEKGEGEVLLDAIVKVSLLPKLDNNNIANAIKGKSPQDLDDIFKPIPGFKGAKIKITPTWLPPKLKKISRKASNITIEVEAVE